MKNELKLIENPICIVDAYSTGKKLANEFIKYGKSCLHIKSSEKNANDPKRNEFISEILYKGNFKDLKQALNKYNPSHIIAGSEMGIELADKLVAAFNLKKASDPNTTQFRRNKYFMQEKLKEKNLSHIRQFKSNKLEDIINWVKNLGSWPIVIKPLNSAASDGVTICENLLEINSAFERIYNQENKLGIKNEEVLVQEYLEGTQYFVNTVSWDSVHFISDIWVQTRRRLSGRAFLFESMTLCPRDGQTEIELCEYTKKILDALHMSHGAAHNEIMWTKDGPILIELNARLMGASIDDSSFHQALGYTQAQLLAFAYVFPQKFIKMYSKLKYKITKNLSEVSLIFPKDGFLKSFLKCNEIKALNSFYSFAGLPEMGSIVKRTEDTLGLPGFVYLLHDDKKIIEEDLQKILLWQRNGEIFEII